VTVTWCYDTGTLLDGRHEVRLSEAEADVVEVLARRPDQVTRTESLIAGAYGGRALFMKDPETAMRVLLSRTRCALGLCRSVTIKTYSGEGYALVTSGGIQFT
jgi:DNA-binding response OmpR family regulator